MPSPEIFRFEAARRYSVEPAVNLKERAAAGGAWLMLIVVDIVMRVAGFRRFHQLVAEFPTTSKRDTDNTTAKSICLAVDRAATFYFKRAWCLQRSAATVCLLRLAGVDAKLVIGVKRLPFGAHAWVEREGEILNDHPGVAELYKVVEKF